MLGQTSFNDINQMMFNQDYNRTSDVKETLRGFDKEMKRMLYELGDDDSPLTIGTFEIAPEKKSAGSTMLLLDDRINDISEATQMLMSIYTKLMELEKQLTS